jgi:predicted DNA-binding transcriptional regulator AlpA
MDLTPQAPVATDDRLLTAAEVAEHLRISTKTLANWSSVGIAPPAIRLPSRSQRYPASDLVT